jgi:hypothetical protein
MQTLNRLKSERPRKKYDFYETPIELSRASIYNFIKDEEYKPLEILDPGAGHGVWGKALCEFFGYDSIAISGVEIDEKTKPEWYVDWYIGDYLDYPNYVTYDSRQPELIIGNPPYSLAEEFVRKSFDLLVDGGYIFFLLRLAFLESAKRIPLYKEFPPKRVYVLQRRPSFFSSNGKTRTTDATSYAMFLWQEGWEGKTELDWLYWEYDK